MLSKKQKQVLERMEKHQDDDDGELVYEKGKCYLGCDKVDSRIMFNLVRLCAITLDQYSKIGQFERYHINETGINLLRRKNEYFHSYR